MGHGFGSCAPRNITPKRLTSVTDYVILTISEGRHISEEVPTMERLGTTWDESTKAVIRIEDAHGTTHDYEFIPTQGLNAPLVCADKEVVEWLGSAPYISKRNGAVTMELLTNTRTDLTFTVLSVDTDGKQVYP